MISWSSKLACLVFSNHPQSLVPAANQDQLSFCQERWGGVRNTLIPPARSRPSKREDKFLIGSAFVPGIPSLIFWLTYRRQEGQLAGLRTCVYLPINGYPTDPFTMLEPFKLSEVHKIRQSAAFKLVKELVGHFLRGTPRIFPEKDPKALLPLAGPLGNSWCLKLYLWK